MLGLYELIRKFEINTPYSTFICNDVFSSDYDTYAITVNLPNDVSNTEIRMNLHNSSGSALTDTNYDSHSKILDSTTGATDSISSGTLTYWKAPFSNSGNEGSGGMMYVFHPYSSVYETTAMSQSINHHIASSNFQYIRGTYRRRTVEQNTGFRIYRSVSPRTFQGVITVYGIE